jgi:Bacterial protein of unknown function (DUF885)
MKKSRVIFTIFLFTCLFVYINVLGQSSKDWVKISDGHTQLLLDIMKEFNPETAAYYGVEGIDEKIMDIKPGYIEKSNTAYERVLNELKFRLEKAEIQEVKQDLQILIMAVEDELISSELDQKYFLPYFSITQTVFYSLSALLDDQITEERRASALVRLKKYTGLEDGHSPITELAMQSLSERLVNPDLLGPTKREFERDLENTSRYIAGIEGLFQKYEIEGYKSVLDKFAEQSLEYDNFLRENVQSRTREKFILPAEVYRNNLKDYGVDMTVEEFTSRAKFMFKFLQNELTGLAKFVAKDKGYETSNYKEVIKLLKKEQIIGEEILPVYKTRIKQIEDIIEREKIITLPQREMSIRLASGAESAAMPAPHMRPPRFIGNTGEMGEFILPLKFPGENMMMDDFTHETTTWMMAVHEGRPGHELQFASLVENGVSLARAIYSMNSVNVEGWALYVETVMKPYLPLIGQFGTIQSLMIRSARAFLDPGLQSGEITIEEARRILIEETGLSEGMTQQELDRYTFRAPGQATSYFCGYIRMMELRMDTELKLGDKFDQLEFHDFILAQGILPPSLLRKAVDEKFISNYR